MGTITETRSPHARTGTTDFETLAENAPDIIARFDRDLRHVYVNPAIEAATGVPRAEALGRTNREIGTPAETCDRWEALLRQCFAEPREYRAEFTVQRPARPRRCYQVRVVPERGAAGSVDTVLAVIRDVSDLRHAEARSADHEQRFRAIFEGSLDAILLARDDGRIIDANPATCQLTGHARERLLAMRVRDLADEAAAPMSHEACWGAFLRDGHRTGELPLRRPDGARTWVEYSARARLFPDCNLVMLHDVSERRRAEENAARLAAIVAGSNDAILSLDLGGLIVDWNDSATHTFGYDAGEVEGRSASALAPPDRRGEAASILARVLAGERVEHFETVRVRKDGQRIDVSLTVSPIRDPAGTIIGFSKTARDITHRKQVQAMIRESEERFRAFMDNSPAVAFMKDEDGRYVYLSAACRARLVRPGEEWLGKTDADLFDLPTAAQLRENDLAVLRSGQPVQVVEPAPDWEGRPRHWLSHKFPFRDQSGHRYVGGQVVDITELLDAGQALRESRERLQSALSASRTGTFRWDIATDRVHADEQLYALFGKPHGPAMDNLQGWIDRIHPDDRPAVAASCRRCVSAGADFNETYRTVWPDGTVHWIHDKARVFYDDAGRPQHVTGACVDVTDRMLAEQALAESVRFARSTVDALSAHIAILDERGTIVAANRAWDAFAEANGPSGGCGGAGGPPCGSVGVNYLEVCDRATGPGAEEASAAADGIRRVLAGDREEFYLEYPCHSPTEQRWFALRVTRFAGGAPVRLVVAHENITARRQAYELQRERASLRDAVTAMEQVLGVVGHELRTPLAGLRAISEFLLDGGARDADQADTFLREMNDEVVRMSDTVNNLLEAARLNSGHATWNWTDFGLERVCDEALASVRPLIDHGAVSLTMTVADPGARMTGDADAVRRLVMNLVSNAVKHTPAGSVHVAVDVVADADRRRWAEVRVSDTGHGMPPEVAARLGEAFALNSGIVGAQYVKGTGLGLNICKGIVAAHGGTVHVDTKLGRGTTVTARLRADLPGPGAGRASIEVVQAAA